MSDLKKSYRERQDELREELIEMGFSHYGGDVYFYQEARVSVSVSFDYDWHWYLTAIFVEKTKANQGYGTLALKSLIKAAQNKNCTIQLDVFPFAHMSMNTTQLKKWYRKHGFESFRNSNTMTFTPAVGQPPDTFQQMQLFTFN